MHSHSIYQSLQSPLTAKQKNPICYLSDFSPIHHLAITNQIIHTQNIIKCHPSKEWILVFNNSYLFLSSFLALAGTGHTIVLPQNYQPQKINDCLKSHRLILTDMNLKQQDHSKVINIDPLRSGTNTDPDKIEWKKTNQCTVKLFTSGSTGQPKEVLKKISQLLEEILQIKKLFTYDQNKTVVFSTVTHQHIYGLLFKILWPYCSGTPFLTENYLFPQDLDKVVSHFDESIFISSPAHLNRIPDLINIPLWQKKVKIITSSGGPLSYQTAKNFHDILNSPPLEIYGSTETGGVATRMQFTENTYWKSLPVVNISKSASNTLIISSPFLYDENPFVTEDLVKIDENHHFQLLGRADRIIKLEEKRISLDEMEKGLNQHPSVKDCHIMCIEQSDTNRQYLATLVEVSEENLFNTELKKQLRNHLSSHFETTCLPKYFRFCLNIPLTPQGKRNNYLIQKILENISLDSLIKLEEKKISDNEYICQALATDDYSYFKDHFANFPIVPGVIQLHEIISLAKKLFPLEGYPIQMKKIKFTDMIKPSTIFTISLLYHDELKKITYQIHNEKTKFASGELLFEKEKPKA